MLLRKKHEPQPASELAEPPKSEATPAPFEAAPQTGAKDALPDSPIDMPWPLPPVAISENAPVAEAATGATLSNRQPRSLLIAAGISFRGEIEGCDRLVIDGAIEGNIKACRHIAVSYGGRFKGTAVAVAADIAGSCEGSLTVEEKLFIAHTARVSGSVCYGRLVIEEGGELDGDSRRLRYNAGAETPVPATEESVIAQAIAEHPVADPLVQREAVEVPEIERMFAAAIAAQDLSRLEEAESLFKAVIAKSPEHAGALANLGRLARQRGDRDEALSLLMAAAKADPQNPSLRCDLANILCEVSRFGEAEAMFKTVTETHREHVGALAGLGRIARQRGELEAAIGYFESAVKAEPRNPDLRCELAAALREASRLDEVERVLEAVIETHPRHVAALTALGHLARQRDDRGATLRWFEAAMAADPRDISIRVEFARALRQRGEFARARQIIEKVLEAGLNATTTA